MDKDKDLVAQQQNDYTAKNIQKLDPREHIRRRPGMYVGGTDARALHHLIYEVVDNSIDEALAGRCDQIIVTLHDGCMATIRDNGVGIPVDMHESGKPALELVMTEIGTGGKFDNEVYKVSGGLHGVGVSAVNALSAELHATIYRDGHVWRQSYSEGVATTEVEKVRPLRDGEETGTIIKFAPDFSVMEENEFSFNALMARFREMAFVTRQVTITLRDERVKPIPQEMTFYFDGGLRSFVRYLNRLTAVVSIKHPDPQFESQTKVKLLNPEVQGAVSQVVTEAFNEFLEMNTREARRIIDKCMTSKRAREAAKKARDLVRSGPSLLESSTLPGKLADCSQRGESAEIYIVEGDSAGGSAKQGRDRHFQAILPLRGKILNTERARIDKILDNNEIKSLISALGTGIHDEMAVDKLRYGRVIIMTDADVDGSHIRTLLLTFFFRHMPQIVQEGHLYIAQPPIYLLKNGKNLQYVYPSAGLTDSQLLERSLKRFRNPDKVSIQRYKGLGEMNPGQLWETTMDPETRTLLQVTIEDAAAADKVFDMLMGASVPPRRRFIQTHAKQVRNLDI